ncbi:hypothetical protein [Pantoea eucalypti]|uniref:hypothetical protein n=1 Tax=Pantoea eucalypti TaxID=470933 RepID=UPI003D7C6B0F
MNAQTIGNIFIKNAIKSVINGISSEIPFYSGLIDEVYKSTKKSSSERLTTEIDFNINKVSGNSVFIGDPSDVDFASEIESNKAMIMVFDLLKSEDYIEGEISKTQIYLESLHDKNVSLFNNVFQKSWLALYSKNATELRKYLCVAACIDYDFVKENADTLILGGASHKDPLVNEAALRAAESWGQAKFLGYLEGMRDFEVDWLQDYKLSVMDYLGSRG